MDDPWGTLSEMKQRQDTRDKHLDTISTKLDQTTAELAALRKRLQRLIKAIK